MLDLLKNDQTAFERFCYNLYKLDWLNKHIPHCLMLRAYGEFFQSMLKEERDPFNTLSLSFEEYIEENGVNGNIYACFDEFLENEYQDESCMQELLSYIGEEAVETYVGYNVLAAA